MTGTLSPFSELIQAPALCLGGLDPSGGAGVLRDAATLTALGVHPMVVLTSLTVQNGSSCQAILPPPDPLPFLEGLRPHLGGAWGVKLGLCALPPAPFAALVARISELAPAIRIWDPILAPTSGVGLHEPADLRTLARTLLASGPWVVSPNLPEAAALAGIERPSPGLAGLKALAQPLLELGASAVWLKGGHGTGDDVEDFWITASETLSLGRAPRLPGDRRGTGCALASAWLALRMRGLDEAAAALQAARFLRSRWSPSLLPGGHGRPCFAPEPPGAP